VKPILCAVHGRDDLVEPLAAMWRRVLGDRAVVVCPVGIPSVAKPGTFTFASPEALALEIERTLPSGCGSIVYAGFSLGAFHGVRVIARDPRRMPRAILIEGGHDSWEPTTIRAFAEGGGERVLFVTGQAENLERSQRVSRELSRAGVLTRIEHAEGAGHVYTGEVEARIRDAFAWVVEGDPRWSPVDKA
jgi:hypothetical protein